MPSESFFFFVVEFSFLSSLADLENSLEDSEPEWESTLEDESDLELE